MDKSAYKISKQKMVRTIILTIVFNTAIALILNYLIMDKDDLVTVFMISQIMGLCICTFVTVAIHFGSERGMAGVMVATVLGLFAGVLCGSLLSGLFMYIVQGKPFGRYFKDWFVYTFAFGIIFGLPVTYYFFSRSRIQAAERKIQEEKITQLTLEKESALISMKLMQAQIEPHFLFNTLSNIISLIDIDIDKAKKMLVDTNAYLRISLQRTRQEMVTLGQEIEFITRYLDIFKIRMGARLEYEINDHSQHGETAFPPMILQPIVENALKYGIEPKPEGGRITIDCSMQDHFLKIVVADTGMGFDQNDAAPGIGLNNVSTRLENIYGKKAGLIITDNNPSGAKIVIEVPV